MSFADTLSEAWERHLLDDRTKREHRGKRDHVWASRRRKCVREMALDLLHPEDEPEPDADALERMRRGVERETAIRARLMQIGLQCDPPFEVIGGQERFEIRDRDGLLLITGKVDGRLSISGNGGQKPVFEIKSGRAHESVTRLEDLDRSPWTRHTLDQILAYLYAKDEALGYLIIDRPKLPVILEVKLLDHITRMEAFLADARLAVQAAKNGGDELPEQTRDIAECRRCPHYGRSCDPILDYGDGTKLIESPDLEEAARIYFETKDSAARNSKAWKDLTKALRGIESGIMGDYLVEGSWTKRTKYCIPAEMKEKYAEVDAHGAFNLKLKPLSGDKTERE